jgi:diguanylate cyclase (GGDEF)-like protein
MLQGSRDAPNAFFFPAMKTPLPDIAPRPVTGREIPETRPETRPARERARVPMRVVTLIALALVYIVSALLGLQLAVVNPSATAVWPPTGIALVAFLLFGYEVWPAILIGAFAANVMTAGTVATSLVIGVGNTLEGVVGAYLVRRFAGGLRATEHARDLFRLAALAGLLSTLISATVGVTTLAVAGFARWDDYQSIWLTWWLGDASGDLMFATALLAWIAHPTITWAPKRAAEFAAMIASVVVVAMLVFGQFSFAPGTHYPLKYLCMPAMMWAAFRFGVRETALAILALAVIAIAGTLHELGARVSGEPGESLVLLQVFLSVAAVMSLTLASLVAEHREIEQQLRTFAVTDPLTGLANHRMFMQTIEREIGRSLRTDRPFAILLLDVNDLKGINDRLGHFTGSEALQRLATAIRGACRQVDTPARYGGDEFAVVLPESSRAAARTLAQRIAERLTADQRSPAVSASAGVAEFPHDGQTIAELITAADLMLYATKARGRQVL